MGAREVYEKRLSDARQLAGRGGVTYARWKCGGVRCQSAGMP